MADLMLSPAEKSIVDYHRNSISTGKVGRGSGGKPITVYSSTIYIPEGKYKGQFATVPGWVNQKIVKDENELFNIWKSDIESGKWPVYKTGQEGDKRAKQIHTIMDAEEGQARAAMKPRQADRSMLMKERLK